MAAGIGGIRCGTMNLARTSLKMLALCTLVLTAACADDGSGDTDTDSTAAATDATDATATGTGTDGTAASDTTPTTGDASTGGTTGGAVAVEYKDIQAIWDGKCVMYCHTPGGSGAAKGPLLGADVSYANIVDKATPSAPLPYIAPGDPEGSYLWAKLNGTQIEAGGDGSPMPLGVPLDDATLAIIEQWILEGANP